MNLRTDLIKPPIDELTHYGVLGMKWGVRKDRDKSNRRLKLEARYHAKGMSQDEAEKAASKKVRNERILIGAAAFTTAAAGAYFANQYMIKHGDQTLKVGTKMQHVAKRFTENMDKAMYVSYLKSDNKEYAEGFATWKGAPWIKELTVTKDLKIAGRKTAEKAFEEWIKTNTLPNSAGKVFPSSMNKSELKRAFSNFNENMVSPDYRDINLRDSYLSFLKGKGYDAIRDFHDQRRGSGIKSPLILTMPSSVVKVSKIIELDPAVLSDGAREAYDFWKSLG